MICATDRPPFASSVCALAASRALYFVSAPAFRACARNAAICFALAFDTAPSDESCASKSAAFLIALTIPTPIRPMPMAVPFAATPAAPIAALERPSDRENRWPLFAALSSPSSA